MNANITIRPENAHDYPQIYTLVKDAFASAAEEPLLVKKLHQSGNAQFGTVALLDNEIVGHVLASPITLTPSVNLHCLGIAPVSVVPQHQHCGIGTQLMRNIIEQIRTAKYDAIFLPGSPAY